MSAMNIPGQPRAEEMLRTAAMRNALSHACLITGGEERIAALPLPPTSAPARESAPAAPVPPAAK